MAIPSFNLVPGRLDVNAVVGNDFTMLLDFDIDLTGYTFDAQVILQNLPANTNGVFSVNAVNLSEGRISINLTDTQTKNIGPLANTKWYFSWSIAGNDRTVLSGKFTLNQPWAVGDYSPTSSPVTVVIDDTTVDVTVIGGAGGSILWGDIEGDIEDQTDLIQYISSQIEEVDLNLNKLSPVGSNLSESYKKIYAINQRAAERITWISTGDSLANQKPNFLLQSLIDRTYMAGFTVGGAQDSISGTVTKNTSDFSNWPNGITWDVGVSGIVTFGLPLGTPSTQYGNDIRIFFVTTIGTPSTNTFKIQTSPDGITWTDATDVHIVSGSTVIATGLTTIDTNYISVVGASAKFTKTISDYLVRVVRLAGTVKVIGAHIVNSNSSGIVTGSILQGGINLTQMDSTPSTILTPILYDIDPTIVSLEIKDSVEIFEESLESWFNKIDLAAQNSDKICIGSSPVFTGDAGQVIQNQMLKNLATDRNYFYFDGYTPLVSYAQMVEDGWQGDGTHPTQACQEFLSAQMMRQTGWLVALSEISLSAGYDTSGGTYKPNFLKGLRGINNQWVFQGEPHLETAIIIGALNGNGPNVRLDLYQGGWDLTQNDGYGVVKNPDSSMVVGRANNALPNNLKISADGIVSAPNLSGTNTGDQYGGATSSIANQYLRRNAANTAYEFGSLPSSAPVDATYIVQTASSGLSNEQALGSLATGIVKNTTTTGVLSIAVAGTDYLAPSGNGSSLTGLNSQQIAGTTTNNNADSGDIGEFVSSLVASGSAVSLSDGVSANITSISLTAGDWDVEGNINFIGTVATISNKIAGISSTSATLPTDGSEVYSGVQMTLLTATDGITLPRKRISISGTTTIYLVGQTSFSAGSVSGFGCITARRAR